MRLYSPVDLTGNVNMIEKLVLGGTGTGTSRSSARCANLKPLRHQVGIDEYMAVYVLSLL